MAVDWDAIQKMSKQLENNMKSAHDELNTMTFTGSSEDKKVKAIMKGSFALEKMEINELAVDTQLSAAEIANHLNEQCRVAINDAVQQIRDYSRERITKLAGDFNPDFGDNGGS